MAERDVISLHLTGKTEGAALSVGRTHTVYIVFVIQRCPYANGLIYCLGKVGGGFFIAEVGIYNKHSINTCFLEACDSLVDRLLIINKVVAAKTDGINKLNVFACKVILYVLDESVSSFLSGNPCKEGFGRTVSCVAAKRHKTDFYFVIEHN